MDQGGDEAPAKVSATNSASIPAGPAAGITDLNPDLNQPTPDQLRFLIRMVDDILDPLCDDEAPLRGDDLIFICERPPGHKGKHRQEDELYGWRMTWL